MLTSVGLRPLRRSGCVALAAACVGAIAALAGCGASTSDKSIVLIQTPEVKALAARARGGEARAVLFIDARPSARFDEAHLPGARRMRLPPAHGGGDPALTVYDALVVYGDNPADQLARAMTKRLLQLQYSGVRFYAGGLDEWRRLGQPVEGNPPAPPPSAPPPSTAPPTPESPAPPAL